MCIMCMCICFCMVYMWSDIWTNGTETDNCWLQACDSGKQRGDNPLSGICANGDLGIIMVDGSEPRGLSTSGQLYNIWHLAWCSTSEVPAYLWQNKKGLTQMSWLLHLGLNNESQISNGVVVVQHVGKYRQKEGVWGSRLRFKLRTNPSGGLCVQIWTWELKIGWVSTSGIVGDFKIKYLAQHTGNMGIKRWRREVLNFKNYRPHSNCQSCNICNWQLGSY